VSKYLEDALRSARSIWWLSVPVASVVLGGVAKLVSAYLPTFELLISLSSDYAWLLAVIVLLFWANPFRERFREVRKIAPIAWKLSSSFFILFVVFLIMLLLGLTEYPPLIRELIQWLTKTRTNMATGAILGLAITAWLMITIAIDHVPPKVLKQIDEDRVKFGLEGGFGLALADIITCVQMTEQIAKDYPFFELLTFVGMTLAIVCFALALLMSFLILFKGMSKRSPSHVVLALCVGVFASILIIYFAGRYAGRFLV